MSAADGLTSQDKARVALRRCADNVMASFVRLASPRRHTVHFWSVSPRHAAIAAGVAVVAFLFFMVLIDGQVARAVARTPNWIIEPFREITDYGKSGWFLWPLGLLFLALAALPRQRLTRMSQAVLAAVMVRVGFLFLAIGAPGLFATIIKRLIGRARPSAGNTIDPYAFAPFIWRSDYAAMPSGHSTTAAAVLVAFGMLWPRARTALLVYAVVILLSRVMVLAHYPSDVLAGAVVGAFGVILVRNYFASRRLLFGETPEGAPLAYPGPSWRRLRRLGRDLLAD